MERTKLTIRLRRDLLEEAKQYANEHNTTLTRRLSGTLSHAASVDEYRKYLEGKYVGQTQSADRP